MRDGGNRHVDDAGNLAYQPAKRNLITANFVNPSLAVKLYHHCSHLSTHFMVDLYKDICNKWIAINMVW